MIAGVIPAAGESRRMGRPKLLLPLAGEPVLSRLLRGLRDGGVDPIVVVGPPSDRPEWRGISDAAEAVGATLVIPDDPPADMRRSIELGIGSLGDDCLGVLIAPADSPAITASLVRRLLERFRSDPGRLVIPLVVSKRGHPIILPFDLARSVSELPPEVGLNALVARESSRVLEVSVEDEGVLEDLDTPEDYRRWSRRLENQAD